MHQESWASVVTQSAPEGGGGVHYEIWEYCQSTSGVQA